MTTLAGCQSSCASLGDYRCTAVLWQTTLRKCYRKTGIELSKCSHSSAELLDLYMRTDVPSPPPLPPRGPGPVRQPHAGNALRCDAMLTNSNDKFYTMWGSTAWQRTATGGGNCWGSDPASFFAAAWAGNDCDQNWSLGVDGWLGSANRRPAFPGGTAPALLGFDETIWTYCQSAAGEYGYSGDFQTALAYRCMNGGQNILRQKGAWNMCVNLKWIACAARGMLPGQQGTDIHFATAPRDLDWEGYHDPSRTGSWWMEPHANTFAVSDVFYSEVAMLNIICANSQDLFGVAEGGVFNCAQDTDGYARLRRYLAGF